MTKYLESSKVFFAALERGDGVAHLTAHATPDATFECDVLPQKTLAEYAEFMHGINVIMPDFQVSPLSVTSNDQTVVFVASCSGTHTGPGGPVPPSDPPKSMKCDYVYSFHYNDEGKITKLYKVFDIWTAFSKLGWPLGQ